jgi:hypothetical protein
MASRYKMMADCRRCECITKELPPSLVHVFPSTGLNKICRAVRNSNHVFLMSLDRRQNFKCRRELGTKCFRFSDSKNITKYQHSQCQVYFAIYFWLTLTTLLVIRDIIRKRCGCKLLKARILRFLFGFCFGPVELKKNDCSHSNAQTVYMSLNFKF